MHNIICRVRYAASKSNNDTTSYNKYEHVTARTKKNGHTKSKNKVHWLYIFVYPHWTTCGRAGAYTNPWGQPLGITRAKAAKAPKSHASEGGQMTWFIKVYQGLSRFIKVYYMMGDHHFMAMAIWGVPKFQSSHIVSFDFRRNFVTLCRCDKSFEYSFFPSRFMQQCRVRYRSGDGRDLLWVGHGWDWLLTASCETWRLDLYLDMHATHASRY